MPAVVPSFIAKVARAKKHLVELDAEIERFADRHPYTITTEIEGKRNQKVVRRLEFTADPANTDIPLVAADVIYNLRSALDHLMAQLVPVNRRRNVMFPVMWAGVWDAAVPGENEQRSKDRSRWLSIVKSLDEQALPVLKALQPPDTSGNEPEPAKLKLLNSLSNRDRHEKLPVVAAGLNKLRIEFREPDGKSRVGWANPSRDHILEDGARIHDIPDGAVDLRVRGIPVVGIALQQGRYVELPSRLWDLANGIETEVFPWLLPFVHA